MLVEKRNPDLDDFGMISLTRSRRIFHAQTVGEYVIRWEWILITGMLPKRSCVYQKCADNVGVWSPYSWKSPSVIRCALYVTEYGLATDGL